MRRLDLELHLHRFDNEQALAGSHFVTHCDKYSDDFAGHWGGDGLDHLPSGDRAGLDRWRVVARAGRDGEPRDRDDAVEARDARRLERIARLTPAGRTVALPASALYRGEDLHRRVHRLLDALKEKSPKIVEEVIPEPLKVGEVQTVLQGLLRERVPIRDLETILETLGDWGARTKDAEVLTEYVRSALARTICEHHRDAENTIHGVTLDPSVEDAINAHVERTERGSYLTMPPAMAGRIVAALRSELDSAAPKCGGKSPVVFAAPPVRPLLRRLIEPTLPAAAVLSYSEIVRGVNVRTHGMVTIEDANAETPKRQNAEIREDAFGTEPAFAATY